MSMQCHCDTLHAYSLKFLLLIMIEMDCLDMVVRRLKPKSSKLTIKHRLNRIVCVEEVSITCQCMLVVSCIYSTVFLILHVHSH